MNTNIKIKPFAVETATYVTFGDISVNAELGEATVPVELRDANGLLRRLKPKITGEDYANWKGDDTYIINKALAKLGIERLDAKPDDAKDINAPKDGKTKVVKKK